MGRPLADYYYFVWLPDIPGLERSSILPVWVLLNSSIYNTAKIIDRSHKMLPNKKETETDIDSA
jgi:hypothetical protein